MWNPLADEDKEPEPAPFSFYSDPLAAYAPGGVRGIKHSTASGARGLAPGPPPPRPPPGNHAPMHPHWRPAAPPSGPPPFTMTPPAGVPMPPQHHLHHQSPQLQQQGTWPQQQPVSAHFPPPHHPAQMQTPYPAPPPPWLAPQAPGSSVSLGQPQQGWHASQHQQQGWQQQGRGWGRGGGSGGRGGGRRPAFDDFGASPKMARTAGPEELEGGAFPSSGGQPQSRAGIGMGGRGGGGGDMPNMGSNPGMGRGGRGGGRGFGGPGGGAGGSDPMARYYKPTFSKDPWSGLLQQHGQPPKMQQQQQQQQQQKEIPADPCPAPPNGGEEASKAQPPKQTLSQILAKVGTKAGNDAHEGTQGGGSAQGQVGAAGGGLSLAELMESGLEEVRGMGNAGDDSKLSAPADAGKYQDEGAMDRPWH